MVFTRRHTLSLFFASLILFAVPDLSAQQEDPYEGMGGTTYLIALPDTVTNTQDARFPDRDPESFVLLIYSEVDQQISIGRAGGAGKRVQLVGGKVYEFDLREVGVPLVTVWNQVERSKVVELKAEERVIVYAYYSSRFGTAAFTPLSVDLWGTEYFAASWPGEVVRNVYPAGEMNYDASEKNEAPAEIMIIAAWDNTEVKITPTADLYRCNGCETVTLNRGEAYIVQSWVDLREGVEEQRDITGTRIESSKPVGVVSANTRSQVEPLELQMLAGNSPKDQMAEWLVPIEHHGREFAYTPDPLGRPKGDAVRTSEEIRLVSTTGATIVDFRAGSAPGESESWGRDTLLRPGEFVEFERNPADGGVWMKSGYPVQAFKAIAPVVKFNGTTGSGNFIGASFSAWGSAMVELVPRERWTRFAAVRAPSIPSDFAHFMTIVTDSVGKGKIRLQKNNLPGIGIEIPERIEGTDIYWTRIAIDPGITYRITGLDGVRFTGHMYGEQGGYELYRPGGTKREGDGKESRPSANRHPSEYEESVGASYAYPFPSPYFGDTVVKSYLSEITDINCRTLHMRVRNDDGSPLNLASITLSADTENAVIAGVETIGATDIQDATEVVIRISARDADSIASGEIILHRSGRDAPSQEIPFRTIGPSEMSYSPDPLEMTDLGNGVVRPITIVNSDSRSIELFILSLKMGGNGFRILRTQPELDWSSGSAVDMIAPGDTVLVWIEFKGKSTTSREYRDSLVVDIGCGDLEVPLQGTLIDPCLDIGDLDFGNLRLNESKTLPLEICNTGPGVIRFDTGAVPVIWDLPEYFRIPEVEIGRLRSAELDMGECLTIEVTFTSREEVGVFRSVARFLADPAPCRDTSVWNANVSISSVGEGGVFRGNNVYEVAPNPTSELLEVGYETGMKGRITIRLVDLTGRVVATLFDSEQESGIHRQELELPSVPAGAYLLRIASGEWEETIVLHVVR